jgi:hypothetical protein
MATMKDKEVRLLILIQVERTDGLKSDISNKSGIRTPSANQAYRDNYETIFGPGKATNTHLN